MARKCLSNSQLQIIEACIGAGDSTYKAAEKANCSEAAARAAVKKYGYVKNALKELAHKEVDTIIMQDEIKTQKNALNAIETHLYQDILLEEVQRRNLTFNLAQKIQLGLYNILESGTKDVKISIGDGVQNIEPMRLEPKDYLDAANANDRCAMTQGIVDRHAPKIDVTQTLAQQTVATTTEIIIVEDTKEA